MIPDCKDNVDIGSNMFVSFCKLIREANWKNNISFQLWWEISVINYLLSIVT